MPHFYRIMLFIGLSGLSGISTATLSQSPGFSNVHLEVREYIVQVNQELEDIESQFDRWRLDGTAYKSISIYMTIDDLELSMRDLRGDLTALAETLPKFSDSVRQRTDRRLSELRREIAILTDEIKTPPTTIAE